MISQEDMFDRMAVGIGRMPYLVIMPPSRDRNVMLLDMHEVWETFWKHVR